MGSSPRMRGTLIVCYDYDPHGGIIPAYAGNTTLLVCPCADGGDHPRICGEHCAAAVYPLGVLGSSPHMRGTQDESDHFQRVDGIIPAYAGNTEKGETFRSLERDHPRICGEHTPYRRYSAGLLGSSPHMRGTLLRYGVVYRYDGIIPAYAGNTRPDSHRRSDTWDHPRICGEHSRSLRLSGRL